MTFRFSVALVLPMLLASGGAITLPAGPALAYSNDPVCVITTYYNNADHDQVVGTSSHCTGGGAGTHTGHTSPYKDTDVEHVGSQGPGGQHGGGLQLPCEFLQDQDGCGNLPGDHYVTVESLQPSKGFGHGPKANIGAAQQMQFTQKMLR